MYKFCIKHDVLHKFFSKFNNQKYRPYVIFYKNKICFKLTSIDYVASSELFIHNVSFDFERRIFVPSLIESIYCLSREKDNISFEFSLKTNRLKAYTRNSYFLLHSKLLEFKKEQKEINLVTIDVTPGGLKKSMSVPAKICPISKIFFRENMLQFALTNKSFLKYAFEMDKDTFKHLSGPSESLVQIFSKYLILLFEFNSFFPESVNKIFFKNNLYLIYFSEKEEHAIRLKIKSISV